MKNLLVITIIGIFVFGVFTCGQVFSQAVSVTQLPEASRVRPEDDDQLQEDKDSDDGFLKKKRYGDERDNVALILSHPLPSFRSNS